MELKTTAKLLAFGLLACVATATAQIKEARVASDFTQAGLRKQVVDMQTVPSEKFVLNEKAGLSRVPVSSSVLKQAKAGNAFALPYKEDFETYSQKKNTLEAFGYTTIPASGQESSFLIGLLAMGSVPVPGNSGYYYMAALPDGTMTSADEWVVSSPVTLKKDQDYIFEMYAFLPGLSSDGGQTIQKDEFKVCLGSGATAAELTKVLLDYSGDKAISTLGWQRMKAVFSVENEGTYYFGINYCSKKVSNALMFDDIALYEAQEYNADVEYLYYGKPIYPFLPEFMEQPAMKDSVYVFATNTGKNELTNVNMTVTLKKNESEMFKCSSVVDNVPLGENVILKSGDGYELPKAVNDLKPDSFEISTTITSGTFTKTLEKEKFYGARYTKNMYARDNGFPSGYIYRNPNYDVEFALMYEVPVRSTLDSIYFVLEYEKDPVDGGVIVYQFAEGGRLNPVGIAPCVYQNLTDKSLDEFIVPAYNAEDDGPCVLEPGVYLLSLLQPKGCEVNIIGMENNDFVTTGMISYNGEPFEAEAFTPFLRMFVSEGTSSAPSVSANQTTVFSTADAFNFTYTDDFTSMDVYNMNGQKVSSYALPQTGTFSIAKSALNDGVYMFRMNGKTTEVLRAVK